jgi:uncharacterized protein (DUF433 family)
MQEQGYHISLDDLFAKAALEYSAISIDSSVMAGAPCIAGTRIPVYMVLDSVEYYDSIDEVARLFKGLTIQQVRDAIGFAKRVIECSL